LFFVDHPESGFDLVKQSRGSREINRVCILIMERGNQSLENLHVSKSFAGLRKIKIYNTYIYVYKISPANISAREGEVFIEYI
jgi:hypothetical protein